MNTRSIRTTLSFRRAFLLPGSDRRLPPGDYVHLVEEEHLQGLTFEAFRRMAGYLVVDGGPRHPGRTELVPVTEAEVALLVEADQHPVAVPFSEAPSQ